ncbi:MAG: mercuric reductase [Deltaproteobacteria bacterium]|nr:mercuric reductase [Deltaproteobacteria bacterium]
MADAPQPVPDSENNQKLIGNVHPPEWINPEPQDRYNLVVIGAGTAGLVTAAGAAGLGAKVALIEKHLMGGDCLNYGCVPSKGVIRAGRAIRDARNAAEFGVLGGENLSVDFAVAMERMRQVRAKISANDSVQRFTELGVDVFLGEARFSGRNTLEVEEATLNFQKAAICTGARAYVPPIPGMDEVGCLTNETVFSLTQRPERLAIIGGGPIGCELAQAFAHLGCTVSIINLASRILPREDAETSAFLQEALERDGIIIHNDTAILEVRSNGTSKQIVLEQDGESFILPVDQILVGAGRIPNVEGLNLEAAGVQYDPRHGVGVNQRLQTSNPHVFAAGDICSAYKFTHSADALARILIANALFGGRQSTANLVIPWCTYTIPEVAHVGLTLEEAERKGMALDTFSFSLAEVDRALLDGEAEGFAKAYLKKGTDRILGATIVANHAGEMINEWTLAMTAGIGLTTLAKTIHPYPTQAEVIKKVADAYYRTKLTPKIKKVLASWLKWKVK